jgi:hypothetical protein
LLFFIAPKFRLVVGFYYPTHLILGELTPSGFAPVEWVAGAGMEVCYPNGVRLVLPAGMPMTQVAAYVRLY